MNREPALERQQVYLDAMGIQRWLPRQALTNASHSADWVAEFVWPPSNADHATPSQVASSSLDSPIPNAPQGSNHQQATQARAEALAEWVMDESSASEKDKTPAQAPEPPSSSEEAKPIPERFRDPRYVLAFCCADDLLIVDSLPLHAKDGLSGSYKKLMSGIARAMNVTLKPDRIKVLRWPAFEGKAANKSGEEAQKSVRRQLELVVKTHAVQRVLILGEPASQWLLEQDQSLEAMRGLTFSLRAGVKTRVSYSLNHMLKLPEFKADCWRDLQALL